jgi:hypothetical protein
VHEADKDELASLQRRYRGLAGQLAEIGFIASGSVALRSTRCGKAYCACHADPPRLHGPYWLFTAKVNGKTLNKRLTETEARLYEEWIANDRKARELLGQMREVAGEAAELILAGARPGEPRPDHGPISPSPEHGRQRSRPAR